MEAIDRQDRLQFEKQQCVLVLPHHTTSNQYQIHSYSHLLHVIHKELLFQLEGIVLELNVSFGVSVLISQIS